jgi:hypothetical protein
VAVFSHRRRGFFLDGLYLIDGHSFLKSDIARVDDTIVNSLRKNAVTVIVLEKTSFLGTHKLLDEMPKLQEWIRDDFEKTKEFGLCEVWTLREVPFLGFLSHTPLASSSSNS